MLLFTSSQSMESLDFLKPPETYSKSPTYEPSNWEFSKRCKSTFHQHQMCVKLQLALRLLLLVVLQLYRLPAPLPPPGSDSLCLFTRCQPPYASCCTGLLYFSRYYTVRFLNVFFIFCLFLCIICVKSIINLLQFSTV